MTWPGVSEPLEGARLRVLSLGAGVQSSTLALMAARGDIGPMPDCGVFSDTQWEPAEVYAWLAWLEARLPFPVYHVTAGNLREAVMADRLWSAIPAYIRTPEGAHGINGRDTGAVGGLPGGQTNRSCTRDYKLRPIQRKVRELLGLTNRKAGTVPIVEQWIGISTDEMQRMKKARDPWVQHRFPLIEMRMSRADCIQWLEERQYPRPTKSACIGCPYHSDAEWRRLKADPVTWADAVEVDTALRDPAVQRAQRGAAFLHRSCVPLAEVDLSTRVERSGQMSLFNEECEGMCGV